MPWTCLDDADDLSSGNRRARVEAASELRRELLAEDPGCRSEELPELHVRSAEVLEEATECPERRLLRLSGSKKDGSETP